MELDKSARGNSSQFFVAEEFDPRFFLKAATVAAKEICVQRFQAFGSAGQAARITPVSLEKIAASYRR